MSTNTPFHQDNSTPPPPPFKHEPVKRKSVPVWAWGLGALLLALIITLVVVLGNRDSEPEAVPAPAVTVTATAEPKPPTKPSAEPKKTVEAAPPATGQIEQTRKPVAMSETEFLSFLREEFPVLRPISDEEIMSYSAETCNDLDAGYTPEDTMMDAVNNSSTPEQAEALGGIVGASVSNYCPEYYNDFTKFLDEQGAVVES